MIQFKQGEDPVRLLSVCEQKQLIKKIMKSKAYFSRKSKVWKKLASLGYYVGVWYYRKSFLVDQLKMKKERSKGTSVDKNEILRIWNGIKVDNGWFRFYNSVLREGNNSFDARYIPLDIQYCYIDDWFNDTESALILDDKNMYDLYFYDVNRPKTIGRIINGTLFDEHYSKLTIDELVERCVKSENVILKPTVFSSTGNGIEFWNNNDGEQTLESFLREHNNYIIQELIHQHDEINKIYKDSVNSIRIVTCNFDGETEVLSSVIRMGVNGSRLDNASRGGMFCGINDDGSLKKYGYTKDGDARTSHPQGAIFSECHIPNYDKCKELCVRLSNRFLRISKLISWDLAVDNNGDPVLIEVNLCYGGADIHQIANGPLFKEKTETILNRVFVQKKKYRFFNRLFSLYK